MLTGSSLFGAEPALAASAGQKVVVNCWGGRCAVYFSKTATRDFALGMLPSPSANPAVLAANAAILGHRIIAQQYANRGWCSAFLISPYPWENKGYTGYPCTWE